MANRWTGRRWRAATAAMLVAVAAACNSGFDPLDPSLSAVMITRDPANDVYGLTVADGVITAAAPATNGGINSRAVFWRDADPVSTDQESCATWTAADHDQQPGIALRAHDVPGGTQVITVTKNIWFGAYSGVNVHLMDTSDEQRPIIQIAGKDLPGLRRSASANDVKPYPWRGCARVVGNVVSLKIWPLAEPEPAWDDPAYGYSVTLPDDWDVVAGHAGSYIGHLRPGRSLHYRDLVISDLDDPDHPGAPAAATGTEPTTPPLAPTHVLRAP